MVKILMEKLEDALLPVDDDGRIAIRNVPDRSILRVDFSVPRNIRMHRLFFAILKLTFEAQQEPKAYPTEEKLLDALKLGVGYVREVRDIKGKEIHRVPDSISFGRMDQVAFKQFFDSVIQLIITRIVPRVSKKDFEQHLYDMLREPGPDQLN